MDVTKSDY